MARAVAAAPGLVLAGFECFEGVLPNAPLVDNLLDEVVAVAASAESEGLLPTDRAIVLSAGGSAFFDRVGERFAAVPLRRPVLRVLRSGCYLTVTSIRSGGVPARAGRHDPEPSARWPGPRARGLGLCAIAPGAGSHDFLHGQARRQLRCRNARAALWYRPGAMDRPEPMPRGHAVVALNDQHCHLGTPGESPLAVGDMVGFGIGHPCTTFDKWSLLMMVDSDYNVVDAVKTFF